MNFLSYLFFVVLGTFVLIFGVLCLFVNRFFKLLSPLFKALHMRFKATYKSEHHSSSKATSQRKSFFNKQAAEDVAFEELA